jgi:integrase
VPRRIGAIRRFLAYVGNATRRAPVRGWEHIDFEAKLLWVPRTKNDEPLVLPLPTRVIQILEQLPSRGESEWVFPAVRHHGYIVEPGKAWRRICARARSLRTCEYMIWAVVQRALNHRRIDTTMRYAHVALSPVRQALEPTSQLMAGMENDQDTLGSEPIR